MREDRKKEVEDHVKMVNKLLEESGAIPRTEDDEDEEEDEEWGGFPDRPNVEMLDHEEEYIDEDRYTTVTVESVSVSRDGLEKSKVLEDIRDVEEKEETAAEQEQAVTSKEDHAAKPKQKKKKFRYENKFDRQMTDRIQRAKKKGKR